MDLIGLLSNPYNTFVHDSGLMSNTFSDLKWFGSANYSIPNSDLFLVL